MKTGKFPRKAFVLSLLVSIGISCSSAADDRLELLDTLGKRPAEPQRGLYRVLEVDSSVTNHAFYFETTWDGSLTAMRVFTVLGVPSDLTTAFLSEGLPRSSLRSKFLFLANDRYLSKCRALTNDYDTSWTIDSIEAHDALELADYYRVPEPYCSVMKMSVNDALEIQGVKVKRHESLNGQLFNVSFLPEGGDHHGKQVHWEIEFAGDNAVCSRHRVSIDGMSVEKSIGYRQLAGGAVFLETVRRLVKQRGEETEDLLYYFSAPEVDAEIDPSVFMLSHYGFQEPHFGDATRSRFLLAWLGFLLLAVASWRLLFRGNARTRS